MYEEQKLIDQLKTLSICHYVYAALAACGSCFGGLYVAFGAMMPELEKMGPKNGATQSSPEATHFASVLFTVIGVGIIVVALTAAVLCFLSARALARHTNRTLSLVVAGVCCVTGLGTLLGLVLGVFTFIVLLKPEAERLYAGAPPPIE
jgi:heme/copper-type cytochrome/quinol oxidase subunit 2